MEPRFKPRGRFARPAETSQTPVLLSSSRDLVADIHAVAGSHEHPRPALPVHLMQRFTKKEPNFVPSEQQSAFFNWIENGQGNAILEAAAGCGKTTTLIQALFRMEGSVFFGAYNVSAMKDIKAKAEKERANRRGIAIQTMHGAGFSDFKYAFPRTEADDRKVRKIIDDFKQQHLRRMQIEQSTSFIARMVSFGKQFLMGCRDKPDAKHMPAWLGICEHFSADQDLLDDVRVEEAMEWVVEVFERSRAQCVKGLIDFDDMIYAPIAYGVRLFPNDWVLIDEAQDINPARRELAKRLLKAGGRAVFVGDPKQSIYGFCHPPGTLVMTPNGYKNIEDLCANDPVIVSHTDGQVQGWQGGNPVLETHKYYHTGQLINLYVGDRRVQVTPHHKVPVALDLKAQYYTYMMRRSGCYRVGYCKAYAESSGEFMLALRRKTERADEAWLLGSHTTKAEAQLAEARLLLRVKGASMANYKDVTEWPTDEVEALKILSEHGRMADFPLISRETKHRFARNGSIITEACNVMDDMRMAFWSKDQCRGGSEGRCQFFIWTPVVVTTQAYAGFVYGITVKAPYVRAGYSTYPLYFAGDDILVHNTGAGGDSLDRIREEFQCQTLPLTVTYRCPKTVVSYVHQWVGAEHIQAHETAPDGAVRPVTYKPPEQCPECRGEGHHMIQGEFPVPCKTCQGTKTLPKQPWFVQDPPTKEDVILCRYTRPLIQTAYAMIKEGIACRVEGRDIGLGLISIARMWKIVSISKLEERLATYLKRELEKAAKSDSERRAQEVEDKVATLRIFIERCRVLGKTTIADLVSEIESMFADDVSDVVTLCTGHKSKGREWPRVFWIQTGQRRQSRKEWENTQEINIQYVIGTRAMRELILVPESII